MSACRSCGAEIIWARTEHGKRMPLDAEEIANEHWRNWTGGTMFVLRELDNPGGPLAVSAWGLEGSEPHYVSHFSSCPNAATHRRARQLGAEAVDEHDEALRELGDDGQPPQDPGWRHAGRKYRSMKR